MNRAMNHVFEISNGLLSILFKTRGMSFVEALPAIVERGKILSEIDKRSISYHIYVNMLMIIIRYYADTT